MNRSDLARLSAAPVPGPNPRMSSSFVRSIRLPDIAAVKRLGAALSKALKTGDAILLTGDLGAGKTELARAILQSRIGPAAEVPSPTFTLVQTYDAVGLQIAHFDLYRIEQVQELAELGIEEALEQGAVLVEWPDRAAGLWPGDRLDVSMTMDGEGPARRARLTGNGRWAARLAALSLDEV